MKRKPAQLRYVARPRRTRLAETRFGPAAAIAAALLLLIALLYCLLRFAVPALKQHEDRSAEEAFAPAPEPTPMEDAPDSLPVAAGTVALVDVADVQYLFDPSVSDGTILFAAGMAEDALDRLVRYDTVTGEAEGVLVPVYNDTLRNPVEDDARIVYVDAKRPGGGAIRVLDKASGELRLVAETANDIPVLFYETPYLLWRERTADGAAKLFACHLGTGDSVTLQVADTTIAAWSLPSLFAGAAVYAVPDETDARFGMVRTVQLSDGVTNDYAPGTYVHDPKRAGVCTAWTSGVHGADNDLYYMQDGGAVKSVAAGVIDFGLTGRHIVYGKKQAVYAFDCETEKTVQLSGGGNAQFAAAGGGLAVWRDMANPETPVWKYMRMD